VIIGASVSLAALCRRLAGVARRYGLSDLDGAAIRLSAPRGFTQEVSRFVYDRTDNGDSPYGGLFYLSRHGDDVADCAIFERGVPFPVTSLGRSPIAADGDDFVTACAMLGLVVD